MALAHTDGFDRFCRIEAAKKLGVIDRVLGAAAYIAIAASCARAEQARLDFLGEAFALAPEPAAKALAAVAEDSRFPDEIRVEAVAIAHSALTKPQRVQLYSTIAQTAEKDDTAMTVARKVSTASTPSSTSRDARARRRCASKQPSH